MGDFCCSYLDRRNRRDGTITEGLHFLKGPREAAMIPAAGAMRKPIRPQDDETNSPPSEEVSGLLRAWSGGNRGALDRLTPIVYDELHRLARCYMKGERPGHSLQTSALVNEAYMRLVDYKSMQWQNRAHFFAVSAQVMRRILVEHARRHNLKRGGGVPHVSLEETAIVGGDRAADLVALDDAIEALARLDPRKARVVEMRFFGGLSVEETAAVLKVSPVTVMRDWSTAKAWLYRELAGGTADGR
jgi:RNA polymerase sigma-70 factor (ECF subfamily)